jgi:two-component system, chemotaxis family, CheB/CheR fusion protein
MENDVTLPKAVVGIGASAGGLNAFTALLGALPADTGMSFVVAQHLAAGQESVLATLLSRVTQMPVFEVQDGPRLEPNTIYVIPPNKTLIIEDAHLGLQDRPAGLHLPVDIFFEALAKSHGPRAIGVVLSGSGSDGMKGVGAIKAGGGITFAQDGSAQHWSMPQAAVSTGCVDLVLPPESIAAELAKLAAIPQVAFSSDPIEPPQDLESVLGVLHERFNTDFSQYKESTLHRRVRRHDRLIAVASHARTHEGVKALAQLRPHTLDDIKGFFVDYNRLHGKKFEILGEHGPKRAAKCVAQGEAAYKKQ